MKNTTSVGRRIAMIGAASTLAVGGLFVAAPANAVMQAPQVASTGAVVAALDAIGNITQPETQVVKAGEVAHFTATNSGTKNGYHIRVTAPAGTTLDSVEAGSRTFTYNADRTVAQASGSFDVGMNVDVSVAIPADALPGTAYTDGSVDILNKAGEVAHRAVLTAEVEENTPAPVFEFAITSPAAGAVVGTGDIAFAGTGTPDSVIMIVNTEGTPLGDTIVNIDGTWSLVIPAMPEGPQSVIVVDGAQDIPFEFVVTEDAESTPLMDPLLGGTIAAGLLAFAGAFGLRRRFTADNA